MVELLLGWPKLAEATCQRWLLNRGDTRMVELLLGWPKLAEATCQRCSLIEVTLQWENSDWDSQKVAA